MHTWFLFESTPWRILKSLSDLNGTDAYIHSNTPDGVFQELTKAFVSAKSKPTVRQMRFLYDEVVKAMPRFLNDSAATDPFNARVFTDILLFIAALREAQQ